MKPADWPAWQGSEASRLERLAQRLEALDQWHRLRCEPWRQIAELLPVAAPSCDTLPPEIRLAQLPWLCVRLFRMLALRSVAEREVSHILQSSGTTDPTGRQRAQVAIDTPTATLQARILVKTLQPLAGGRRPVILLDALPEAGSQRMVASAAATAGIRWFATRILKFRTAEGGWDLGVIRAFLAENQNAEPNQRPVPLLFGMTASVWQLMSWLEEQGLRLKADSGLTVLHTGGWKKLARQQVSKAHFNERVRTVLGAAAVRNYYGMAEQVGSIFPECSAGYLHCSAWNHLIIRDPATGAPAPTGTVGQVQVFSAIPESYPGHSLLTEDLGRILIADGCACGWSGPAFEICGRVPRTEVRGCSNV